MSQLPRLQKGQGREMLLKSVELGSQLPESCSWEVNLFEESSSSLAFERFSLLGTCRLNSKSCQLWLSPLEAQTQRAWIHHSALQQPRVSESAEAASLTMAQLPWNAVTRHPGAWFRISLNREANHGLRHLFTRQEAQWESVQSSLRTNVEILAPCSPSCARPLPGWVKPGSAPLYHCDHRPKCSVCRATRLWAHRTDDSENQSLV